MKTQIPCTDQQRRFDPKLFNVYCNNILQNGYDEYLTTIEGGITHSIFTNTDPLSVYNGSVCDVYSDGRIEYSRQ